MPYGQGRPIGQGSNPALGLVDYRPLMQAQQNASATLADSISGVIKNFSEQNKQIKSDIAKGKSALAFAKAYHPELANQIDELGAIFQDPSKSALEQSTAGAQMGEFVAAMIGGERFNKEMALREQGLEIERMDALSSVNARNAQTNLSIDSALALGEIGAFNLGSALNFAQGNPSLAKATGISAKDLEQAKDLSAPAQAAIAESYFARLPKEEQAKYINDFPVNIGGTNAKVPGVVQGNTFFPAQIAGDLAPPDGVIPEGMPIDATGVTVDGAPGVLPPRIVPGNIQGQDPLSPTEKIAVAKYQDEQAAKQQAGGAALAKSVRMVELLDQLDKHPGFDGLFGAGVGLRKLPGTDAAGAETLFKQIEAMGFIEAIKDMKGMGALSNAEGEKVSAALVGMDPKMPEKEARAKISEVKQYMKLGADRMQSGKLVNPDGSPHQSEAAPADAATGANGFLNGFK